MYPILCKIKFEILHRVFQKREIWVQIAFSIFMNWIVAPFFMVGTNAPCPRSVPLFFMANHINSLRWRGHSFQTRLAYAKDLFSLAWPAASLWYFHPQYVLSCANSSKGPYLDWPGRR